MVSPHNPDSQKPPRLPMYHPGFKLSERIAQQTLSVFHQFIGESKKKGINEGESHYLCTLIKDLEDINYESEVRIAVTGDTGSGKSATVNSILGEEGLTPEVGMTSRCDDLVLC